MSRYLTPKVPGYLQRLHLSYGNTGKHLERDLIAACRFLVIEDVLYDNWNGGTYGHDLVLFLPIEELGKVGIDQQADLVRGLCDDLNKLARSVENESFNEVHLDVADQNDADYQRARPFYTRPWTSPDTLSFWKPGFARLFISHRDQHKVPARELSDALEQYGISSFVAHDTIKPMSEWRSDIMKGLETMEVLLVYLTDDFEESLWCHQEVGFALGKGVPIISLKLGRKDPPGFLSHVQALRGHSDNPYKDATGLFPLIGSALGRQDRLQEILVTSFVNSPSWADAKARFDRLSSNVSKLTPQQVEQIVTGFRENDQLHNASYLTNDRGRLKQFLEKATADRFTVSGQELRKQRAASLDDEIPF